MLNLVLYGAAVERVRGTRSFIRTVFTVALTAQALYGGPRKNTPFFATQQTCTCSPLGRLGHLWPSQFSKMLKMASYNFFRQPAWSAAVPTTREVLQPAVVVAVGDKQLRGQSRKYYGESVGFSAVIMALQVTRVCDTPPTVLHISQASVSMSPRCTSHQNLHEVF